MNDAPATRTNWVPSDYLECMKEKVLPCACNDFEFLLLSYDTRDITKLSYYYGPRISEDIELTQISNSEYAFYTNKDDAEPAIVFSVKLDTLIVAHAGTFTKYIRNPYTQLDTISDQDKLMGSINMLMAKEYFENKGVSIDKEIDASSLLHCFTESGYRLNVFGFTTKDHFLVENKGDTFSIYKWLNMPVEKVAYPELDTELVFRVPVE